MKKKLRLIYSSLLFVSFFSSCLLFFIVAAESTLSEKKNTLPPEERISSYLHISKKYDKNDVSKTNHQSLKTSKTVIENKHATNSHKKETNSEIYSTSEESSKINHLQSSILEPVSFSSQITEQLNENGQPVIFTVVDSSIADIDSPIINTSNIPLEGTSLHFNSNHTINKPKEASLIDATTPLKSEKTEETPYIVHAEPKIVVISSKEEEIIPNVLKSEENKDQQNEQTTAIPTIPTQPNEEMQKEPETPPPTDPEPPPATTPDEMPSFSEWAQKQLAEEERSQPLNESSGSSSQTAKTLLKNFASPDCGAKIVGSNPEAKSASSVLSPSLDEYLLNACTSRIWFIIELCEGIQAKRIELANFELFSSSPRNFTISVSDRYPTRDWRTVGQFEAKDERNVQNFPLTTHLYAKYVRFELLSHYGQEHFCPISLFRVYGTSEFEVLDTDSQSQSDEDDDDDEDESLLLNKAVNENETEEPGKQPQNLFGSARDAVLSIVKKAAQVLVKGGDQKDALVQNDNSCITPSHIVVCNNCSESLYESVYSLLSCQTTIIFQQLQTPFMMKGIGGSEICLHYGLDFTAHRIESIIPFRVNRSAYLTALLPENYLAAFCNALAVLERKVVLNVSQVSVNIPNSDQLNIFEQEDNSVPELLPNASVGLDEVHLTPISTCSSIDTNNPQIESPASVPPSVDSLQENKPPLDINPTRTLPDNFVKGIQELPELSSLPTAETIQKTKLVNDTQESTSSSSSLPSSSSSSSSAILESEEEDLDSLLDELTDLDQNAQVISNGIPSVSIITQPPPTTSSTPQTNNHPASTTQSTPISTTAQPQQKESVFQRLSNRIKTLERNMSLSGQYLEELSRRYKRQVEEMQRVVERTLATVGDELVKRAAQLEIEHSKRVEKLEVKLNKVTSIVESLLEDRDSWSRKIILSLQLSLLVGVEVGLISAAVCWCYGYGKARKRYINNQNSHVNAPNDESVNRHLENIKPIKRRLSIVGVPELDLPPNPSNIRQRRSSEEALNIIGYDNLLGNDSNEQSNSNNTNGTSKAESRRRRKKRREANEAIRRVSYPSEVNQKYYPTQQTISLKPSPPLPPSISPSADTTKPSLTFTQRRLSAPMFIKTALASRESRRGIESAPIKSNVPPSTKLKSDNWEWYSSRKSNPTIFSSSSPTTPASSSHQTSTSSSSTQPSPPLEVSYNSPNGHSNNFASDNSDTLSSDSRNKKQSGLKKIFKKFF